jgi:hypothetical protein
MSTVRGRRATSWPCGRHIGHIGAWPRSAGARHAPEQWVVGLGTSDGGWTTLNQTAPPATVVGEARSRERG